MRAFFSMCLLFLMTSSAFSKQLTVMFGLSRPPFIVDNPPSGISLNLFRELNKDLGYKIKPVFASNKRMEQAAVDKNIDVIVEVQKNLKGMYYSSEFISYRNHVIVKKNGITGFNKWSDLKGVSVCAWQNADKMLGDKFISSKNEFKSYREFGIQVEQVRNWLVDQCQAILIDDTLFKYHLNNLINENPTVKSRYSIDYELFPFPGNHELWFYIGFKDRSIRDKFDDKLKSIKSNGTYQKIRNNF